MEIKNKSYLFPKPDQRCEPRESSFRGNKSPERVELLLQHVQVVAEVLGDHGSQRAVDQLLLVLSE